VTFSDAAPDSLDQPAFNRNRLKAEKLIDSKVLEQLIRVQVDAGCSRSKKRVFFNMAWMAGPEPGHDKTGEGNCPDFCPSTPVLR